MISELFTAAVQVLYPCFYLSILRYLGHYMYGNSLFLLVLLSSVSSEWDPTSTLLLLTFINTSILYHRRTGVKNEQRLLSNMNFCQTNIYCKSNAPPTTTPRLSLALDARGWCKIIVVDTGTPTFSPIKNKTVPFTPLGQPTRLLQWNALRPLKPHQLPCAIVLPCLGDGVRVVSGHIHRHDALFTGALGTGCTVVNARRTLFHRAERGVATSIVWKQGGSNVFQLVQVVLPVVL